MGAGAWATVRADPCGTVRAPGTRSPGSEFDPVWSRIVEAGILVGMHTSDSGYAEIANWWEESSEFLPLRPSAFRMMAQGKRPIYDAMAALICHGALSQFPICGCRRRERGQLGGAPPARSGRYLREGPDPVRRGADSGIRRNIYVNPFWEDDMSDLAELVGADHILFGSNYPHPEGLHDPISYVDELKALDDEDSQDHGWQPRRPDGCGRTGVKHRTRNSHPLRSRP